MKKPLLPSVFVLVLALAAGSATAQVAPRAYAPENLRTLSVQDQTRVISLEYSEQSRGRRIPDDQLRFYLDQVNRSNWTFSRIKQDIAQSLGGNSGGWENMLLPAAELALDWHIDVPETVALPEAQSIAVFRIFQEMLSNVLRHAQARQVRIQVRVQAGELLIRVQDDGRGADSAAFEAHDAYGVMGMRERAAHFGASLQIESHIGLGSAFTLRWPLLKYE